MSLEIRGKALRVAFRYQGKTVHESIPGGSTPENVARWEALDPIMQQDIRAGTFDYGHYFPWSKRAAENQFGTYLDTWLKIKANEVAASSFKSYTTAAEVHLRPKWGGRDVMAIDHIQIQEWVQSDLMPKLHNKTIKGLVSCMGQVFRLYRTRNKDAHDPTEGIYIRQPDAEEPDPFSREEIRQILRTNAEDAGQLNLFEFMVWSGPRISEGIALAWEDVDLERGEVTFQRALVSRQYKVTKTRRSKRRLKLLRPALEALRRQHALTGNLPPVTVGVVDRDNRTIKPRALSFVFLAPRGEPFRDADQYRNQFWAGHLKTAGVRYRGPNQCRHTFASQLLTSGGVNVEWVAEQMGHTSTAMIWRHYGKWIKDDERDQVERLNFLLGI
jgi:integrase